MTACKIHVSFSHLSKYTDEYHFLLFRSDKPQNISYSFQKNKKDTWSSRYLLSSKYSNKNTAPDCSAEYSQKLCSIIVQIACGMSLCTRFRNFQCCNTENLNSRRYICVYSLPSRQHSFKSIPFRLPMSEMTGCLCQFGVFRSTGSASHIPSRFPDLQIDTRLLLLALWGKQWNLRSLIPCIQWPDRSGISPDSLSDIQTIF